MLGKIDNLNSIISKIKGVLNLHSTNLVGVDIGLSAVKVAEVKTLNNGDFKLLGYASEPLPEGAMFEDEIIKPDEIVEVINKAIEKSGIKANIACIGISGARVVTRKLQLSGGTVEEIEDQALWEIEQYLPFVLEESTMSFHVVGENEGGGVDVIVGVAKNDLIEEFKGLVEQTNLIVKIIDTQMAALTNTFECLHQDKINKEKDKSWILVDLGAQRTELIIYRENAMVFTKELGLGGVIITEEIQRQMGVKFSDAEDLKRTTDENGNLPEEVMAIIEEVLESFFAEFKKTLDFYFSTTADESFHQCYITGGGMLTPGLIRGLESVFNVPVHQLNPFEKFKFDKNKFKDEEILDISQTGVMALGLAIRDFL